MAGNRPKLAVVGEGGEADKGNPVLIALLERLTLEARSGDITGISAVVSHGDVIELIECHEWGWIYASGAHQWASQQTLSDIEIEE